MVDIETARDLLLKKDGCGVRVAVIRWKNEETGLKQVHIAVIETEFKEAPKVREKLLGAQPHHVSEARINNGVRHILMTKAPQNVKALVNILNNLNIQVKAFHPNFEGELPTPRNREELLKWGACLFAWENLSEEKINEALNFLDQYEERYYEDGNNLCYHRKCKGGAVTEDEPEPGVYCSRCGRLPHHLVKPYCFRLPIKRRTWAF